MVNSHALLYCPICKEKTLYRRQRASFLRHNQGNAALKASLLNHLSLSCNCLSGYWAFTASFRRPAGLGNLHKEDFFARFDTGSCLGAPLQPTSLGPTKENPLRKAQSEAGDVRGRFVTGTFGDVLSRGRLRTFCQQSCTFILPHMQGKDAL